MRDEEGLDEDTTNDQGGSSPEGTGRSSSRSNVGDGGWEGLEMLWGGIIFKVEMSKTFLALGFTVASLAVGTVCKIGKVWFWFRFWISVPTVFGDE